MHKTKENKTISCSLHSHRGSSRFSDEGRPLPLRPEGDVVGARSHEPARCASGTVARMRSSPVDPVYGFPGLQTAVCYETTQIQRRVGFYGQWGFGTNPRGRNIVPAKTSDQGCPERASPTGFLLPLFSHSEERELVPSPHIRSPCVKQTPAQIHVQDVNTQSALSFNPSRGLVCNDRSVRRIFSHCHLSRTPEISPVRFSEQGLRKPSGPVRAIVGPESVQQVCGGSTVTVKKQRHPGL